jgi:thioesterase domain-containing protein
MQLQRRIEKELGKQFPLAAFFQAPTVASQYEFLTKSGLSRQRTFDLTPGKNPDSPTLFCFHFAFIARLLAKHIGQNVRVVAVESNLLEEYDLWLKTGRSNTTLTALAKNCVADVQRIQPHGPYYLGGFCFGGNLAAEVAHQLAEKGEKIGFVALFNSYHHSSMQTQVYPQLAKWSYHLEQTLTNGWAYVSMKLGNWAEKRATRGSRSAVDSLNELETFDTEETKATQSNFTRQLLDSHSGSPFPVKTLLFRAVSDPQPLRWQYDPAHGWGDLLLGDLTCHDVLCSHSYLVKESKLAVVADKLNSFFPVR